MMLLEHAHELLELGTLGGAATFASPYMSFAVPLQDWAADLMPAISRIHDDR